MTKKPPAQKPTEPPVVGPAADPASNCIGCRHYYIQSLLCRRFPPTPMATGRFDANNNPIISFTWPQLQPWGRCGEFSRKDNESAGG